MDAQIIYFIKNLFSPAWAGFFKFFAFFGSTFALTTVTVVIALLFVLFLQINKSHMLLLSAGLASITSFVIKRIVGRTRPELFVPLEIRHSPSFPSGHALITTAIYGILAYFLAEKYPKKKWLIYSTLVIFLFLIGISRLYLGVHWPTDVLAGWLIGGAILLLMIYWYKSGGIKKTFRITFGIFLLIIGLIGLVLPIIPGIPLLIVGFLLVFSNRPISGFFKRKKEIIDPMNQAGGI